MAGSHAYAQSRVSLTARESADRLATAVVVDNLMPPDFIIGPLQGAPSSSLATLTQMTMDGIGTAPIALDHPLAPNPYADHADATVGSSLAAFTAAFARNRVLHCYAIPASATGPY